MSRAIVIQLDPHVIRAVIAHADGNALKVDDVVSIPVEGADLTSAEKQFAAALEPHHPHKALILLAAPSSSIKWQYLSLPPSPPEDLPALVSMQLDLEGPRDEEEIGYDFLPFAGNDARPQRVLAMILKVAELARVRNFYRVAGLKVEGVAPLALGWTALGDALQPEQSGAAVFVAIHDKEATIWSKTAGQIALLRQVQLAADLESGNADPGVSAQLRRTLLSLAQEGLGVDAAEVYLLGNSHECLEKLADSLRGQFSQTVRVLRLSSELATPERAKLAPLLGLAWEAALGNKPRLDFLHPRRPPEPQSNHRTFILAGIAATLLAALLGWQAYVNLYGPLWQAEGLRDELYTVNQEIRPLETEERDAARIREWLAAAPNVLTELAEVARDWRPEPTDSPEFSLEKDGVIKRIDINNRAFVLTGNVANSSAVQPLENRLRDENHQVRRQLSAPDTEGGKYPWQVQIVVEVVNGAASGAVLEARP